MLKFRSFVIELGHLFYQHFPEARLIFLYRHFDSWARSVRRTFRLSDPEMQKLLPQLHEFLTGLIPGLAAYSARKKEPLSEADFMTWMWLSAMERGLDLQRQGLPFFPVRYEELKADPRQVIEAMFAYCGVTTGSIERLATILAQDSQAKTFISQAKVRQANQELSPEHLAEMHRLISQISTTITPDFIVPGTFFPI